MTERTILAMTAPCREDFIIPIHEIGPGDPAVALVSGLHGNELNGVYALARLADFLNKVESGGHPDLRLTGKVVIIPAVNVLGVNIRTRFWPFDNTDLNRMFPGYELGETGQRIAGAVLDATKGATWKVDIHASNPDFEELPQVRLYEPTDAEKETARGFRLPAIVERPVRPVFTSTLMYAWRPWEGESFLLQVGQAGDIQLNHCQELFRSLVAFLGTVGVLDGVQLSQIDDASHYFGVNDRSPVWAKKAGMFVSDRAVGRWMSRGERIGYLYDSFDGSIIDEVQSPVSGLLTGLRRQPMTFEGDMLARINTR